MVTTTDPNASVDQAAGRVGFAGRLLAAAQGVDVWVVGAFACAAVLISPVIAVFFAAAGDSADEWAHLASSVLPRYVGATLMLMVGVALISLLFGVPSAWVVSRYRFPGRGLFSWMLLLPAAAPAYIVAYAYVDLLEFAGPVQGALREAFGWRNMRDYWFPEIRSIEGASLVMGAVLYPYVYMMARASFLATPAAYYEVAMVSRRSLFWSVALPIARPAIVAGLALAMMETISDFGTVEYFAVETMTLGIFNVWLGKDNLAAAAQIAIVCFLFVIGLLAVERIARARRRFTDARRAAPLELEQARGWRAAVCVAVCATPILLGFGLPVGVLASFVLKGHSLDLGWTALAAGLNSILLAVAVTAIVLAGATFLAIVATYRGGPTLRVFSALAASGYAFPGVVLAIGAVTISGFLNNQLAFIGAGGWLSASFGLVAIACAVRFQAVGYGAVTAGLGRISPNMFQASRTLGYGFGASIRFVILPLLSTPLLAAGLLVFVDVMKELPMTLLLRPFNFETLPTLVYQYAKDELLEEAAAPALAIIAAGVVPVVLLNAALSRSAESRGAR